MSSFQIYKKRDDRWKWVARREAENIAHEEAERRRRIWGTPHKVVEGEQEDYLDEVPEETDEQTRANHIKVYQNVKGIGPATAEKIYDSFGPLINITEDHDLEEIPGIGPATKERILDYHNG